MIRLSGEDKKELMTTSEMLQGYAQDLRDHVLAGFEKNPVVELTLIRNKVIDQAHSLTETIGTLRRRENRRQNKEKP